MLVLAVGLVAPAPASARYLPGDEPPADDWLSVVNYYRATAYLPPVTASAALSSGAQAHAEYMVRNDSIGHSQDPTKPGFTVEGNVAAGSSNVAGGSAEATPRDMIEMWMRGPFHALGILRPGLQRVGFGIAHDNSGLKTAAALDVIRGLEGVGSADYPISWPGNGTTQPISTYWGGEYPDPISGCGYSGPTGVPLIVQFSRPVDVSTYSLTDAQGNSLAACQYDGSNYRNSNADARELGRLLLAGNNAAVVVPRQPLVAGQTYTFSVTSNGQRSESTFTVTDLDGPRVSAIRVSQESCRLSVARACRINFSLAEPAKVAYRIETLSGAEVRVVYSGEFASGSHVLKWDKRNAAGTKVRAATYIYELISTDEAGNTRVARGRLKVSR
jgi:hypothetical protein